MQVGQKINQVRTSDLSEEFIQSAYDLIEEAKNYDWRFTRSKIITSCIASFSAIEAYLNRIFFDCFSTNSNTKLTTVDSIPETIKQHIKASWQRLSIKDKSIMIISLVSISEPDIHQKPFNLFFEFIKFRNRLVHAKSWETEYLTLVTHVNLNEKKQGSWAGKILDSKTLHISENYPLTKFSADLAKLNVSDAEKALEIALMTIYQIRKFISGSYTTPGLTFRIPKNKIDQINGEKVLDMIKRHFL